jgi:uncharacterized protein
LIYLVDGHNLIPKIPGLNLRMLDDELKLVQLLQIFARVRRVTVEVFFDQAPAGYSGTRRFGMVAAHFVLKGTTADQEMISRIQRMKKTARGVSVVTSDRRIRIEAQAAQAKLLLTEEFARLVIDAVTEAEISGEPTFSPVSGGELNEWMKLFGAEDELDK